MEHRLPPLRALRAIEAIQQTGSVTNAARRLNVSHSAVSHQIRQFEAWSGVTVMHRNGRRASLTDSGESLARVVHEAFDAIRHEMDCLTLRAKAPVTIAALPLVAAQWLLPRMPGFLADNPDISLHLSYAHSDRSALPEPEISILFGKRNRLPSDAIPFLPGAALPVCAPTYLAKHPDAADGDLAAATLLHDEDLRLWHAWFQRAGIPFNESDPRGQLYFEGSSLLREAALTGQGVAICRSALIAEDLRVGRLVGLSAITVDDGALYYIRLSPRTERSSSIERIVTWLTASSQDVLAAAAKTGPDSAAA